VLDACKAAGFTTIELVSAPAGKPAPSAYVIEPPDVLKITAAVRSGNTTSRPFVDGQYVVRPDGTVGLGSLGSVTVSGLTVSAAADAVRKRLADDLIGRRLDVGTEDVSVSLDVVTHNSKRYYVIIDDGKAEAVYPFPAMG